VPTFSPPAFVTNIKEEQTLHVTFTTTITPVSRSFTKYTFVQLGKTTATAGATNINMSTGENIKIPTSTEPSNPQRSPRVDPDLASGQDTA
jgi:hypothetical protein